MTRRKSALMILGTIAAAYMGKKETAEAQTFTSVSDADMVKWKQEPLWLTITTEGLAGVKVTSGSETVTITAAELFAALKDER